MSSYISVLQQQEMQQAGFSERDYGNMALLESAAVERKAQEAAGRHFQQSDEVQTAYRELRTSTIKILNASMPNCFLANVTEVIAKTFFSADKEVIVKLLKKFPETFSHLNEEMRRDRKFALEAIKGSLDNWEHIDLSLKEDEDFIVDAMIANPHVQPSMLNIDPQKLNSSEFHLKMSERFLKKVIIDEPDSELLALILMSLPSNDQSEKIISYAAKLFPLSLLGQTSRRLGINNEVEHPEWFNFCVKKIHHQEISELLKYIYEFYEENIEMDKSFFEKGAWQMDLLALSLLPRFSDDLGKLKKMISYLNSGQRPLRDALRNINSGLLQSLVELLLLQFPPLKTSEIEIFFANLPQKDGKIDPSELQNQISYLRVFLLSADQSRRESLEEILKMPFEKRMASLKECVQEFILSYATTDIDSAMPREAIDVNSIMDSPRLKEVCIYLAKQQSDRELSEAIKHFLRATANESFKEERYRPESSPHLQQLADQHPSLLEAWKELHFTANLQEARHEQHLFSFREFLEEKLAHGHLPHDLTDALLRRPEEETKKENPEHVSLAFEECLHYLEGCKRIEGSLNLEMIEQGINLFMRHYPGYEFINDLRALLPQKVGKGRLIECSDSWEDLLVCGTDVPGSCQRVDGEQRLNKCLLAYIMDGKNRLLCVKDDQEKIVGRAILRLLFKEGAEQAPVIYMEEYYGDPSYEENIQAAAKEISQQLGVELYDMVGTYKNPSTQNTRAILHSYGSSVPYEYCDAVRGVTNGIFSHQGALVA